MKKTKIEILTIMTMIVLALSLVSVTFSIATAQPDSPTWTTYAFISAMPNPVGVGQEVLIYFGITDYTSWPKPGWDGLTIEVTKPDGQTETLGPFRTDTTGGTGTVFVPDHIGTYRLQAHFPEQILDQDISLYFGPPFILKGTLMLASSSNTLELVVQSDPIASYPSHPLPTQYWTRPIDAQHREWYTISGHWLENPPDLLAPYNDGPETIHILWTKPLAIGGLVGGEFGPNLSYEHGSAYQFKFENPVILNGILYYNRLQLHFQGGIEAQGIIAVDLHTGEELWFKNNTRLAFGQIAYWDSFNMHGAFPYLWETVGTTWNAYDAFTGEWV